MSKKKGLGSSVEKSFKIMDGLVKDLKEFSDCPLKDGLSSNKITDDQLSKMINEAMEEALSLRHKLQDLKHKIKEAKPAHNSRFAKRVIANFLESSVLGD